MSPLALAPAAVFVNEADVLRRGANVGIRQVGDADLAIIVSYPGSDRK